MRAAARTVAVGVVEPDARSAFERAAGWSTVRAFKSDAGASVLARRALPAGRSGYCFRRAGWLEVSATAARWSEDKVFAARLLDAGHTLEVYRRRSCAGGRGRRPPRCSGSTPTTAAPTCGRGSIVATRCRRSLRPARSALVRSGRAGRGAAAAGAAAYLAAYGARAARDGLDPRALAWVPMVRAAVDAGKVTGCVRGALEVAAARLARSP